MGPFLRHRTRDFAPRLNFSVDINLAPYLWTVAPSPHYLVPHRPSLGMTSKRKKSRVTDIHFSSQPLPTPTTTVATAATPGTSAAGSTNRVLREKTRINHETGRIHHNRSVVTVAAGEERPAPKVHPDVRWERPLPIYDLYSDGDDGGNETYDEDGAREPRDSVREPSLQVLR